MSQNAGVFPRIVEVEASSDPDNYTGVFRNATHPCELVEGLVTQNLRHCWDMFLLGCAEGPHRPCIGTRLPLTDGSLGPYVWKTYHQIATLALQVYNGIERLQLLQTRRFGDLALRCIGIYMKNRLEWIVLEQMEAITHILNETSTSFPKATTFPGIELDLIFLTEETLESLCNIISQSDMIVLTPTDDTTTENDESSAIRHVVLLPRFPCLDESHYSTNAEIRTSCPNCLAQIAICPRATQLGLSVLTWGELLLPSRSPRALLKDASCSGSDVVMTDVFQLTSKATRDSIQTICYTSGTTGCPKGVMITHNNLISSLCGCLRGPFADYEIRISRDDCHISYLPMAHIYERVIVNLALIKGARVGMFSGCVQQLLSDLSTLQPTVFVSVPRVFNRINDRIYAALSCKSKSSRALFQFAMSVKLANLRRNPRCVSHPFWDRLIFRRIARLLGGKIRYLLVGGAALDLRIQERMAIFFSVPLLQGYGLTEVVGAAFNSHPSDPSGYIGAPLPSMEYKLKSVPDLNYYVTDSQTPRGELLLRGPSVTPGYFLDSDMTKQLFEHGEWMLTGDIVELERRRGILRLIDRRKNLFKLVQGEYIVPEKLEAVYEQAALVEQIFVFGYPTKAYLVAIVFPDVKAVQAWCETVTLESTPAESLQSLCFENSPLAEQFHATVLAQLRYQAKVTGLHGFERVHDVTLTPEPFTIENGLLTPTLKLRRHELFSKYKSDIDRMYKRTDSRLREQRACRVAL